METREFDIYISCPGLRFKAEIEVYPSVLANDHESAQLIAARLEMIASMLRKRLQ